jgi:hypothetical protein
MVEWMQNSPIPLCQTSIEVNDEFSCLSSPQVHGLFCNTRTPDAEKKRTVSGRER